MKLLAVTVISCVIVLSILCSVAHYLSLPSDQYQSNDLFNSVHNDHTHSPIHKTSTLELNLINLKHVIKSIRKKKSKILLDQLSSDQIVATNVSFLRDKSKVVDSTTFNRADLPEVKSPALSNLSHVTNTTSSNQLSAESSQQMAQSRYIQDGVFWSKQTELLIPRGFTSKDDRKWIKSLNTLNVVKVENGCGRMQNRMLTLENGDKVCARYRKNNDQIQGEFFSFLLARILGIENLPPSTLTVAQQNESKWKRVTNKLKEAQWEARPVVLTKYISQLMPAYIPNSLRTSRRHLYPLRQDIDTLSTSEIIELVQWSDLIVLDYLTANLDRMLNNMINEHWNPQMMDSPAHNLLRQSKGNLLLFLDNESGLFHGYRLLKKYESLHRSLLDALCTFRQSTVSNLEKIDQLEDHVFASLLSRYYHQYTSETDSSYQLFPQHNMAILKQRIRQVLKQVHKCRKQFYKVGN